MPIFEQTYLENLIDEAEIDLSAEANILFDRISLAITQGNSLYTLPDGIKGIIQVTWKSEDVTPAELIDFQEDPWIKPQNQGVQAKPKFYLRHGNGYKVIQFYPIPDETITGGSDTFAELSTHAFIQSRVILSVYRFADPSGDDYRLPTFLFRNVMKYQAMSKAYAREGKQQDLNASAYFANKYLFFKNQYFEVMRKIPKAIVPVLSEDAKYDNAKPHKPSLPTGGKWSI